MGEVLSQAEGFTSLGNLWGAFAFHAVATALGASMLGKSISLGRTAPAGALPEKTQA